MIFSLLRFNWKYILLLGFIGYIVYDEFVISNKNLNISKYETEITNLKSEYNKIYLGSKECTLRVSQLEESSKVLLDNIKKINKQSESLLNNSNKRIQEIIDSKPPSDCEGSVYDLNIKLNNLNNEWRIGK